MIFYGTLAMRIRYFSAHQRRSASRNRTEENAMNRLLITTACIAALSVPAFAQSETEAGLTSDMQQDTEIENSLENAAEATQETASDAVDYTQEQAAQAAEATEDTAEAAADATAEAASTVAETAENAGEAAADAASDAGNVIADTTERAVDATVDTAQSAAVATAEAAESAMETMQATLAGASMSDAIMMDASFEGELVQMDAPMIEREGWVKRSGGTMTLEELVGTRVYTAQDDRIGEIDNVVINEKGDILGAVLGVGGFIGIGEKDVIVTFDSLTLLQETDGSALRAYVDATEESMEELPAYSS
jgi:sporulation protein YlmC with PRC-barrel domain